MNRAVQKNKLRAFSALLFIIKSQTHLEQSTSISFQPKKNIPVLNQQMKRKQIMLKRKNKATVIFTTKRFDNIDSAVIISSVSKLGLYKTEIILSYLPF